MLHTRKEQEALENEHLAPYASRSADSKGRKHPEPLHRYRTEFQRDRDRILHAPCFRRLEYKTQVFVNGTADHYRTRLTHTMEMVAVGRTLARALRVNEDLAETIALAHDIGHSPFGHCGERALDELMKEQGGFDHNEQSLRWVEGLEERYPTYKGLNLTWEVRAGLRKHRATRTDEELDGHPIGPFQSMEAQIADVADDLTYHAHDVDDGLEAGLLTEKGLDSLDLWRLARERAHKEFETLPGPSALSMTIRSLLDLQVDDVLLHTSHMLGSFQPRSPGEVMCAPQRIVTFSPAMKAILDPFREYLFKNVYWHNSVERANNEAVQMMKGLFRHYLEHPDKMGEKAQARLPRDGIWRTACDYVSGMTDRYAIEEYLKFDLNRAD